MKQCFWAAVIAAVIGTLLLTIGDNLGWLFLILAIPLGLVAWFGD